MRALIFRIAVVVLIAGIAVIGYLLAQQNHTLRNANSRIASLTSDITTLENSLKTLEGDISQINPVLQSHINATVNLVKVIQPVITRISVNGDGFAVSGSGFIIRSDGYVLTNQHVIDAAQSITLTLSNGDKYIGTVISADNTRDLALLKMDTARTDFPVATMALTSDIIVGDDVVACGFPLGLNLPGPASFTRGIISAIRTLNGLNFVQTDCEIDPGSSGGCLVNLNNEVVGMTSDAVLPPQQNLESIALAIPVGDMRSFVQNNLK